jgi:COP9 signalosome complex subunit 5
MQIMGMLQGKIVQDTFIVMDSFALPVEGTETRVNAQAEAYEYMVDFADTNKVGAAPLGRCHHASMELSTLT